MRSTVSKRLWVESFHRTVKAGGDKKSRVAYYRQLKKWWSKRNHAPGCQTRFSRRPAQDRRDDAIERSRAIRTEREKIYRKYPELDPSSEPKVVASRKVHRRKRNKDGSLSKRKYWTTIVRKKSPPVRNIEALRRAAR